MAVDYTAWDSTATPDPGSTWPAWIAAIGTLGVAIEAALLLTPSEYFADVLVALDLAQPWPWLA